MKKLLALVVALAAPASAFAIPVTASTAENITFRDCQTNGDTACDYMLGPVSGSLYDGAPGAISSSAANTVTGYGSAAGSVSLSGVAGAPVIRGSATSEIGKRTNSNSVAVQRYTYTGATTTTRTFEGALTYSQLLTGSYGIPAGIHADIGVFTTPTSTLEVGDTVQSNFDTLFALFDPTQLGYTSLASQLFADELSSVTNGTANLSATVTLNPGDAVWVYALVTTSTVSGGFVDASHTFVTSWNDATDLVPSAGVTAVPLPSTVSLLVTALAVFGMLGVARRYRRQWRVQL